MRTHRQIGVWIVSATWLVAATSGLLFTADYDVRPGHPASPARQWPGDDSFARNSVKPMVLLFVHPHCPCSRASLSEFARLAQDARDRIEPHVLFVQPEEVAADWFRSELWETAFANRELHVNADLGGVLAKRFGVATSGQVLVYDHAGTLRFAGGITPSRGHSGNSLGRERVLAIADGHRFDCVVTCATFGCSLTSNSP